MADDKRTNNESIEITVGGSIGFKIQGNSYESIDASTIFTLKKTIPANTSADELREIFDKTNKILSDEAAKKMKIAYNTYLQKIANLKGSY